MQKVQNIWKENKEAYDFHIFCTLKARASVCRDHGECEHRKHGFQNRRIFNK